MPRRSCSTWPSHSRPRPTGKKVSGLALHGEGGGRGVVDKRGRERYSFFPGLPGYEGVVVVVQRQRQGLKGGGAVVRCRIANRVPLQPPCHLPGRVRVPRHDPITERQAREYAHHGSSRVERHCRFPSRDFSGKRFHPKLKNGMCISRRHSIFVYSVLAQNQYVLCSRRA